ncbi:hypothetical protein HGRIS_007923 [Hohenbuehelia grisea]|uniref:Uncharacterized protein n=1 Tax=Hohenbuehelia grisea TaxID=104357 RepID=A0ABR3J6U5_9AGAR
MLTDFHSLIREPFGPYPTAYVLNDSWLPNASKHPVLKNVLMASGPRGTDITGLDETEHLYATKEAPPDVFFYGELLIESLDWLSERGLEWLEQDLRERDQKMHLQNRPNTSSGLTLRRLYGDTAQEGLRIKVIIRAEKRLEALYLSSKKNPTSMVFVAHPYPGLESKKTIVRRFNVESLEAVTCSLSRNYLLRWRLIHAMDFIKSAEIEQPSMEDLTISYYVAGYKTRILGNKRELYHRYIFDDQDDDIVDRDTGRTMTQRYLRHVSPIDVKGVFAAHAEWILAQQLLVPAGQRLVDIRQWYRFCQDAKRLRRQAREKAPRRKWGLPFGELDESYFTGGVDLSRFNISQEAKKKLQKCLTQKTTKQPSRKKQRTTSPTADDSFGKQPQQPHLNYDSDFSVRSSDSASTDSEDDLPDPDPMLIRTIPTFCWNIPELPSGGFVWHCPAHDCPAYIDLLEPTLENLEGLPPDVAQMLLNKTWENKQDPPVRSAFLRMANKHYQDHLKLANIKIVRVKGDQWTVEWDDPKRCLQERPKVLEPAPAPKPVVKEEEWDSDHLPSHVRRIRRESERLASSHNARRQYTSTRQPSRQGNRRR